MRVFTRKRTRSRVHRTQRYPLYAALIALVAVAATLTIVGISKASADRRLTLARTQLATQIQSNLDAVRRTVDRMDLPSADVQGDLLPTIRTYLYAAEELNEVIVDIYGRDSSMMNAELFQQIDLALTEVGRMITEGRSISTARAALTTYMAQVDSDLARFADSGLLLSHSSLK